MSGLVNSTNAPSESDEALPGAADNGPSGASPVAPYLLGLADDAMVYAQRLSEWMTNAPQIEEDMALGNIALDLLGQARALYPYIGSIDGTGRGEDDYAMLRDERDWRNVHLVEQERGDFADEMARLLWFSAYQVELHAALPARPTTSSRASPARRSRRCATTSTTPRCGSCASATARRSRTAACRPPSSACCPTSPSSSTTTRPP